MNISIRSIVNAQFKFSLYCKKYLNILHGYMLPNILLKLKNLRHLLLSQVFYHIANHWQS